MVDYNKMYFILHLCKVVVISEICVIYIYTISSWDFAGKIWHSRYTISLR